MCAADTSISGDQEIRGPKPVWSLIPRYERIIKKLLFVNLFIHFKYLLFFCALFSSKHTIHMLILLCLWATFTTFVANEKYILFFLLRDLYLAPREEGPT